MPGFVSPLAPEELAGLACEEEVTARLVLEKGGDYPWQLRYGPFDEQDFAGLPQTHWTLLVQEVDRHAPAVADLLEAFRFVPNWRLDDVMASFAVPQGGVGAHVDNYDVFLLQGLGRRRWQISHTPLAENEEMLVPDLDVSMLADFSPDEDWVLEPGDLLYLPPRLPHYGVALDDCITYSIGFRAPSHADLASGFLGHVLETLDPALRYADPGLKPPRHPGEIHPEARATIRAVLRRLVEDDEEIDRWFGRFITLPARGSYPVPPDDTITARALRAVLRAGGQLRRSAVPHFAYVTQPDGGADLFVAGEAYGLDPDLAYAAPLLTGTAALDGDTLAPHLGDADFVALLADLVSEGFLIVQEAEG